MIDWEKEIKRANENFKSKYPHTEYVAFNRGVVCLDGHFDVNELRSILAEQERLEYLEPLAQPAPQEKKEEKSQCP